MTMVVNETGAKQFLAAFIAAKSPLSLRLYSNNRTPIVGDLLADYTSVVGGGYAAISLLAANWGFTIASPSVALYNAFQDFNFTGPTNAPSVIYGYYIVDADNLLVIAERFPAADVPFTPINGSLIRIKPRITNQNLV